MLFTFPSRYLFTIDLKKYLVLGHSRPGFMRDFTSPALLKKCYRRAKLPFAYGAITRSGRAFQLASTRKSLYCTSASPLQEAIITILQRLINIWTRILQSSSSLKNWGWTRFKRFRLLPVRSPLLGE